MQVWNQDKFDNEGWLIIPFYWRPTIYHLLCQQESFNKVELYFGGSGKQLGFIPMLTLQNSPDNINAIVKNLRTHNTHYMITLQKVAHFVEPWNFAFL